VRARRAIRLVFRLVLGTAALGAAWLGFVWPPPSWYRTHWPSETAFMRMRARQGRGSSEAIRYRPVPLDSISPWLGRAATVGEDDAFYQHHGIDWHAMREALGYRGERFSWSRARDRAELWRALGHAAAHRDRLRGASTITQQLAKNLYLSPSRNPLRKVKEAVIAYRLEWALPKDRILELYLNVAELGPDLWGAEAASRKYFGRDAARLTIDQAAMLVATLPHPLTSNPAHRPGRTLWRQQFILRRLRGEDVVVPPDTSDDSAPDTLVPDTLPPPDSLGLPAPVQPPPIETLAPAQPDTAGLPEPGPAAPAVRPPA